MLEAILIRLNRALLVIVGALLVIVGVAMLWRPEGDVLDDMFRGIVGAPALAIGIAMLVGSRWIRRRSSI